MAGDEQRRQHGEIAEPDTGGGKDPGVQEQEVRVSYSIFVSYTMSVCYMVWILWGLGHAGERGAEED